jgi:molybdate transport system ATP-binding protein
MIRFDLAVSHGSFALDARAEVPASGITAIFGPSAAGKSTLLRALAGLEAARGSFRMGDDDLSELPAHKRGVGVVFQDARLFAHLSVAGNLDYAARRARAGSLTRGLIVEALGLAPLLARNVVGLSGGERQRVAIARALSTQPRLLLMDEPVSALDLPRRAEILGLIESLPRRFGIPVFYVTHAIDEVARIADHVLLMRDGTVALSGPVQAVFADERLDAFTGHFEAGSLLEAVVQSEDKAFGLSLLAVDGVELAVPVTGLKKRSRVRLRIRARDVAIAVKKPSGLSIRNVIPARIAQMREDGAHAEIFLEAGGQMIRARITRASAYELQLKPGMKVHALLKTIAVDRQLF